MDKFCVFCGSKPESKNKEHILPQWLLKLTGDPNREIFLGRKWHEDTFIRLLLADYIARIVSYVNISNRVRRGSISCLVFGSAGRYP